MSSPEPNEVLFAYIAVASYAVSLVLIRVDNGVQWPVYYVSKSLHEAEVRYLPLEKAILAVVLSTRKPDEVLFAYIAVAPYVVSLVLIRVDNGIQRPVYYVSKSLHEAEVRYLPLEKAILAVVLGTRKLPHYFKAHTVVILTQLPLKTILRSADYTGRIAKWGTILGAFDIKYMPHTSIKGQVLADLVAEFTKLETVELPSGGNMDEKLVGTISQYCLPTWEIYVDGASNQKGSGIGLVMMSPEKVVIEKSLRFDFLATNNEAEYESSVGRNDYGPKNGWKFQKTLLGLKACCRLSKRGIGGKRREDAGVP